ncbi:MAG: glycosyltransferase family 4 protein [Chlorobiaceae bacterium]|nr:glycosyltransferase family 4 protein [Chlorobiaceae bacterium]NTW63962.1 glycosyltransferase family 4 protein [Chlorobiaceae bacterium]
MNIGIDFTHDLGYSGIGTYCRSLTESMIRIEPENQYNILTLHNTIKEVQKHFTQFRNIVYSGLFPNPMVAGSSLKKLIIRTHPSIWKKLARNYDLVHFTHQGYFVPGIDNAAVTIHDLIKLYNRSYTTIETNHPLFQKTKEMINDAVTIFVPSEFVRREINNHFPGCEQKVRVTYEGIKPLYRKTPPDPATLRKYGLADNRRFFLYVGRYEARKNLDRLMLAYAQLPATLKKDTRLVLICPTEIKSTRELQKKISDAGLEKNVLHLTHVSDNDLVHLYNAAIALLFVSFSEGFGLPLVEAMNCGCPAIIANCSSLPEISGGASLLVDPHDTDSIRHAMLAISEGSQLRNDLSKKCAVRAQRFSWDTTAQETLKGYHAMHC